MANVENICQLLQKYGWYLKTESIQQIISNGKESTDDIIKAALNNDLTSIGEKLLAARVNGGNVECIEGPLVLQIQKVREISLPKENELASLAPQQIKLTLTDGHMAYPGLVAEDIEGLSRETPIGAKLRLEGRVPIVQGHLQLTPVNCQLLGGIVEKLSDSNIASKKGSKSVGAVFNDSQLPKTNGVSVALSGNDSSVESDSEGPKLSTTNSSILKKDKKQNYSSKKISSIQGSGNTDGQLQKGDDDGKQNSVNENGGQDSSTSDFKRKDGGTYVPDKGIENRRYGVQSRRDSERFPRPPRRGIGRGYDSSSRSSRSAAEEDSDHITSRAPVPPTVFDYMPDTVKEEVKDAKTDSRPSVQPTNRVDIVPVEPDFVPPSDYVTSREDRSFSSMPKSNYPYRQELPPRFRRKQEQRERQSILPPAVYMSESRGDNDGIDAGDFPPPTEWDGVSNVDRHSRAEARVRDHNSRGFIDPNRKLWDSGDNVQERQFRDRQGVKSYRSRQFYNSNQQRPFENWDNNLRFGPTYWVPSQQPGSRFMATTVMPPYGQIPLSHFVVPEHHSREVAEHPWNVSEMYPPPIHIHHQPLHHHNFQSQHQHPGGDHEIPAGTVPSSSDGIIATSSSVVVASEHGAYMHQVTRQMHDLNITQSPGGFVAGAVSQPQQARVPVEQSGSVYMMSPYQNPPQPIDSQVYPASEIQTIEIYTPAESNGIYSVASVEKVGYTATSHEGESRQDGNSEEKATAREWQIGDLCMARYWQDGQLYRATIASIQPENECCTVHFVDYGNIETVLLSDLAAVPPAVWESSGPVALTAQSPQQLAPVYLSGPPVAFATPFDPNFAGGQPPIGLQLPPAGASITYLHAGLPVPTETPMYGMQPTIYIPGSHPPS